MEEVLAFGMNPKGKKGKGKNPRIRKGSYVRVGGRKVRHNPKGGGYKAGGFSFGRIRELPTDAGGVALGLIVADVGVRKVSDMMGEKDAAGKMTKTRIEAGSAMDAGASLGAALGSAYLVKRFAKSERLAVATYHGGLAVTIQKILGMGKEEPLGDKIVAGYGSRLRQMFAGIGDEPDILFIPAGDDVGSSPDEETGRELGDDYEEEEELVA